MSRHALRPIDGSVRPRGQSGYTLIELLLVVAISAIMLVPLMAWTTMVLRQQPVTRDGMLRTAQSGLLQAYFPRDVIDAGAADDYQGAQTGGQWDTWRQDCVTGGGAGGRPLAVLLTQGPQLVKTIYSVAPTRRGGDLVADSSSIWRSECVADTGALLSETQLLEDVDDDPAATRSSCFSATLANDQPDSPCRQVRISITTDKTSQPVVMSATRRIDARGLEVDPTGNFLPVSRIAVLERQLVNDGTPALRVRLSGADSRDPDGAADGSDLSYQWELPTGPEGSGAASTVVADGPVDTEVVLPSIGVYSVRLTVTDGQGATNTTYRKLDVTNRTPIAVMDVTPLSVTAGAGTINMSAAGSTDPDGSITSFAWVLSSADEGGGVAQTFTSTTASYAVPATARGPIVVELTVTDDAGADDTASMIVEVVDPNAPPPPPPPTDPGTSTTTADPGPGTLVADFAASPAAGTAITFDATASSGPITSYTWTFGLLAGGGTGAVVTATYPASGTYTVQLTVSDGTYVARRSLIVVVPGDPAPPTNLRTSGDTLSWDPAPGARRYLVEMESTANGCARIDTAVAAATAEPSSVLPPSPCTGVSTVQARVGTEGVAGGPVSWSGWVAVVR